MLYALNREIGTSRCGPAAVRMSKLLIRHWETGKAKRAMNPSQKNCLYRVRVLRVIWIGIEMLYLVCQFCLPSHCGSGRFLFCANNRERIEKFTMTDVITYFEKGGLVMWPLLVCSLFVIYIAIDRFIYYKSVESKSLFVKHYCDLLAVGDIDKATALAVKDNGLYANILVKAAPLDTVEKMNSFIEMKAGIIMANLRNKLNYLNVIVTLSPLLGLLGTIVGMITTFSVFNLKAGEPMAITGGIGEALIATASGLCVAILALIVHSYYAHRLDNIITDMEQCFSALTDAKIRGGI